MFLLISENDNFNDFALRVLNKLGKVTAVSSYNNSIGLLENVSISHTIVYTDRNSKQAAMLCRELRAMRRDMKLITAVKHDYRSVSRYLDIPESDLQLNLPCAADDLTSAIQKFCPDSFSSLRLTFGTERQKVIYAGQHFQLSKTDYAILRIIAACYPLPVLPEGLCGFFEGKSHNCIAAHICNINKNADKLSHRRLIVSSGKGYSLNPLM